MTDNKDSRQMPNRCISCGCITEDPDDCFCEKCLNKRKVMYFFFVLIYCIIIAPVRTFLKSAELFVDYSSRWLIMLVLYFAITLAFKISMVYYMKSGAVFVPIPLFYTVYKPPKKKDQGEALKISISPVKPTRGNKK